MNKDNKSDNQHLVYFIVPIYNVTVDEKLLGKSFAGYKILPNTKIVQKYGKELFSPDNLFEDIKIAYAGMVVTRPLARYVFFKKLYLHNGYNKEIDAKNNTIIDEEVCNFNNLFVAMRLLKSGNIQINRVYIIGKKEHRSFNLPISTFLESINDSFRDHSDYCFWDNYSILKKDLSKTLRIINNITRCSPGLWLPINYFMSYYRTCNLADKLIKLCTIWETTLLNDCTNELNYRLMIRGSAFLNKNLQDVFKSAYDIRSKILHTGLFPKQIKLTNIINSENKTETSKLFAFLRDCLEPITRDIINQFIINHIKTEKDLNELAKSIDEKVFEKLSR